MPMASSSPASRRRFIPLAASMAACVATSLAGPGPALAQSTTPAWTIAPVYSVLDADGDWKIDPHGNGLGLRLGKSLTPNIEMQLGYGSASTSSSSDKYRQTLLGLDGLYRFNAGSKWRPFLSAGLGAERDHLASAGKTRTSPYLSLGGGLQYWFTDRVALQAELKRVHGFLGSKGRDAFNVGSPDNNYLGLGLVFAFGGDAGAARPAAAAPAPAPAPRAAAAPAPAPAAPAPATRKMERVTLDATELFEFRSAVLRMPQPKLDELADLMNRDPSIGLVKVTGHTDRLGSKAYNDQLSDQRAQSVRNYLLAKGVDGSRIEAVGVGSSEPVKDCPSTAFSKRADLIECLAPNRRVEVEPVTGTRPTR